MDIGVVQNVDTAKGTVDVLIHGTQSEYSQTGVPIVRNSDTISVIPKIGARCLLAKVGNEMVCMGYLPKEGAETEAANDSTDLQAGDFRIGNETDGMIGTLEGGMLVALANGTGIIILRDKREVDLVGKDVSIDTPSVHKTYKTDDLGGAVVNESVYGVLGQVESTQVNANLGTYEKNISRMNSIKIGINSGVSETELALIGKKLLELDITLPTDLGEISLRWDVATQTLTLNSANPVAFRAPFINQNTSIPGPQNAVITGSFFCPALQKFLWQLNPNPTTVYAGNEPPTSEEG